jgi:hypothetical protein
LQAGELAQASRQSRQAEGGNQRQAGRGSQSRRQDEAGSKNQAAKGKHVKA